MRILQRPSAVVAGLFHQFQCGLVGAYIQIQLAEQRVIGSVQPEDLAQHVDHVLGQAHQRLVQPDLTDLGQKIGLTGQNLGREGRARGGKKQVLGHRQRRVVLAGVKEMRLPGKSRALCRLLNDRPQRHQPRRQFGVIGLGKDLLGTATIKRRTRTQPLDQLQPPVAQRTGIIEAREARLQPVTVIGIGAVARTQGFGVKARLAAIALRAHPDRHRHVFPEGALEQHRARGCMTDP